MSFINMFYVNDVKYTYEQYAALDWKTRQEYVHLAVARATEAMETYSWNTGLKPWSVKNVIRTWNERLGSSGV